MKTKMNRKNIMLSIMLLVLTISISFCAIAINTVKARSYHATLNYGDYYSVSSIRYIDDTGYIEWSFTGSNTLVNITVWIYDKGNFSIFQTNASASGYQQSDDNYTANGTWNVQYFDKWFVVFMHNQSLGGTTYLTIGVNFIGGGLAENALWYGLALLAIFVVVVLIFLVNHLLQVKKKSSLEKSTQLSPSSYDLGSKTKMMSRLDKREDLLRRERILEGGTLPELSELILYSPAKNEKIASPEVDVRGKAAIKSIVWINNQAAFVDVDGSFIGNVKLFKGKNPIDIIAIDPYGNNVKTGFMVNCTSKEAIPSQGATTEYLLPNQISEFKFSAKTEPGPVTSEQYKTIPIKRFDQKTQDSIVVPESEIDPSILAELKGEPIIEEPAIIETAVDLDEIEPELPPEESVEVKLPEIPQIPKEEIPAIPKEIIQKERKKPTHKEEPSIKAKDAEKTEDKFPLDEMLPITPTKEKKKVATEKLELDEFKPLKSTSPQELIVETKTQELDDDRLTIILQHSGLVKREDEELVPIIKIEKRIEKIGNKWFSTLGIANITDEELKKLEISEFVTNTLEITEKLPNNVQEPLIDHLPEGVKATWVITKIKPQMKIFISYSERVNPLHIITEEQKTPTILVKK